MDGSLYSGCEADRAADGAAGLGDERGDLLHVLRRHVLVAQDEQDAAAGERAVDQGRGHGLREGVGGVHLRLQLLRLVLQRALVLLELVDLALDVGLRSAR